VCGIAGCYQQADGQRLVDIMTDRIAHRGPDAAGFWKHEDGRAAVHLGHRRLSIIDLSTAADQPLSKDGLTLVYNGELYNYRTLRAELVVRGVRFVTESDTEVVLEAWRYWGPEALLRFRGMFAFALFDERTGEMVLVRDPLGIKPLYYLHRGDGVIFASELKALVAAVGSELRMEPGALVASMLYYWLPEQRCAIDGVQKLPGGSWARLRPDGTFSVQSYWRASDVPDDAVYARKVAAGFGVRLHEIEISPDIVDLLPRIVDVLDEPIGDPAAINTLLMCQAARERGVKVILSGMGADELFGGYRKHLACVLASQYHRLPAGVRHGVVQPAVDRLPVSAAGRGLRYARWAKRFLTFAELPEEPRFRRSYTLYDPSELAALISPDLACHVEQVIEEHSDIYHDNSLQDEVNRMCLADTRMFLPGLNLNYTDRASMAASVEVRVPFVDPVVAQAAFSIDGGAKIRRRQGKVALKQAAESWLPHEIAYRPKASFSAPLRAWVRGDLQEVINDVLAGGELVQSGMIRQGGLQRLIQEENDGREDRSKQIWQLLTLELWYRHAKSLGVAA